MALTKPVDSIKPLIFKNEDEGAELRMNFLSRHHTGCRYRADYGSGRRR